jgi:hypothetical protein
MTWTAADGGYDAGIYRLRREPASGQIGWRLEVAMRDGRSERTWAIHSMHRTRREAASVAEQLEGVRTRRLRIAGHVGVGIVASFVFVAAASMMDSLGDFVVAMVAMFVGLRAFVNAISVRLGDAWDWHRSNGVRREAWADRFVARALDAVQRSQARGGSEGSSSAVRVLPPTSKL